MHSMSDDILARYRRGEGALPATQTVWPLYGAGFENLGQDGKPIQVPLPAYGPDEILVRHDALGLCFSDLKVINAGQSHPRIHDDMREHPVILGHELAVTVVGVGANRRHSFGVGDRFVVQADVYYQGRGLAVGYALPGGLQQYSVMGREILDGDEGCYLLPLGPNQGYAEAALAEPWACVEAAYTMEYRSGLKAGGAAWFVGSGGAGHYTLSRGLDEEGHPQTIVLSDVPSGLAAQLRQRAAALGVAVIEANGLAPAGYAQAAAAAGVEAFDDVVLLGPHPAASITAAGALVAVGGVLALVSDEPYPEPAPVDVGRLHYDRILLAGTSEPDIAAAYHAFPCEVQPGGVAWIIGAGGPMGQMHVQRLLQLGRQGPRRLIASDLRADRLAVVQAKFGPLARQNGIDLVSLVDNELTPAAFGTRMAELTDGRGPDYAVVLAPVAAVVARTAAVLAEGAVLNVFAGLPRGTLATLDLNAVRDRRQLRIIGSSGSGIADLRRIVDKARTRALAPEQVLAAVSGLEDARVALQGVAEQRYDGKVVVYPQAVGLPLTTLAEMPARMPAVAAWLGEGGVWTLEAEEALLREYLRET
jgi:threonine dehydrogenase-like Zn-dependent dehydrogenase